MIQVGGSFLVRSHDALSSALAWLLPQVVAWTWAPAVAWFIVTGAAGAVKVAGDPKAAQDYVADLFASFGLLIVCCTARVFTEFVHGGVFETLPAWIGTLLASFGETLGVPAGGARDMGAALNGVHAQAWTLIAESQSQAGVANLDAGIAALVAGFGTSVLVALMSYSYGLAEWLLVALCAAAPPVFALAQWRPMRDVVWRWAGYVVSVGFLFFLGVAVLVVAVHLLTAMLQEFIDRQAQANAAISSLPTFALGRRIEAVNAAMEQNTQMLCEVIAALVLAVLTTFAVPAIAHSLGSGVVAGHGMAGAAALYAVRDLIAGGIGLLRGAGGPGGGKGGGRPNYDLSMAGKEPARVGQDGRRLGSTARALPPPRAPIPRD